MNDNSSSKARQSTILRVLGTVIAFGLLVYLLHEQGWEEIKAALFEIEPWRLIVALVLMFISRLAVASRWHTLLKSGGMPVTPAQSIQITFAGLFAGNFLPTTIGGDVIRLAGTLRLNFDVAVSAASLIADRLVGMAGMVMILPVGLPRLLQIQDIRDLIPTSALPVQISLAATPFGNWVGKLWGRFVRILRRLISTITVWLRQPRALLLALLFTWIHQICIFSMLTLFFGGMGDHISFWLVGGLYSFVYLITLMPISINGYGLQEISMTLVFSRLGGASLASSLTAALLFRTTMMIASLPGALFVPSLMAYTRTQVKGQTPPAGD